MRVGAWRTRKGMYFMPSRDCLRGFCQSNAAPPPRPRHRQSWGSVRGGIQGMTPSFLDETWVADPASASPERASLAVRTRQSESATNAPAGEPNPPDHGQALSADDPRSTHILSQGRSFL